MMMISLHILSYLLFEFKLMNKQLVLPPGLENLSTHTFGQLYLKVISSHQLLDIVSYCPLFMGSPSSPNHPINSPTRYSILTNLWHFYVYLTDMESLPFEFTDAHNDKYFINYKLPLKNANDVLNTECLNQQGLSVFNDCHRGIDEIDIFDSYGNKRQGKLKIELKVEFDRDIHNAIKDIIDFSELLVIDSVSPITSENQLPREPPSQSIAFEGTFQPYQPQNKNKQQSATNINQQARTFHPNKISQGQSRYESELEMLKRNYIEAMGQSGISEVRGGSHHKQNKQLSEQEISRMMEEDIDRLIAEMQEKPYDSSRYQGNEQPQQNFRGNSKAMNSTTINLQSQHTLSMNQRNCLSQTNFHQPEKSSIINRPPLPLQSRSKLNSQQKSVSREMSRKKNLHSHSDQNLRRSNSIKQLNKPLQNSEITIKIHELLVTTLDPHTSYTLSEYMNQCYSIRVYLNDSSQQYYSAQGIPEGQNLVFNQTLKLRNIPNLELIKFALIDQYGYKFFEGIFKISRLIESNNQKGMFMIPMVTAYDDQEQIKIKEKMKIKERKVAMVDKDMIVHRTLRIEGELIQRTEFVQIYIKVSQFDTRFKTCKYKIPFTKQCIQFCKKTHQNIFPHNIIESSRNKQDTLILQFWDESQLIGQSRVSLKNIKNYNIHSIDASIQPICLYDSRKEITNPFNNGKIMGRFKLQLYFGNVRQINKMIDEFGYGQRTQPKIEVTKEERLGVLIKEKKSVNEVEIQTELEHKNYEPSEHIIHERSEIGGEEPQELQSHNQFISEDFQEPRQQQESINRVQNSPVHHKISNSSASANKSIKKEILPTISQRICCQLSDILKPLLPQINSIKSKCKPFLLYNFIEVNSLVEVMQSQGISNKLISEIFQQILLPNISGESNMVNLNILLDYCMHIEFDGQIKQNMLGDNLLIETAIRILYSDQKKSQMLLLTNKMEFEQFQEMYQKIGIKPTLHQYSLLQKFISKFQTIEACQNFKQKIMDRLADEIKTEVHQGMYENDIIHQIYGSEPSSSFVDGYDNSFAGDQSKITIKQQPRSPQVTQKFKYQQLQSQQKTLPIPNIARQQIIPQHRQNSPIKPSICIQNSIKIFGISNVKESAQCLFDRSMDQSYVRLRIQSPTFQEIIIREDKLERQFYEVKLDQCEGKLEDADGIVQLCQSGKVVACARFCLIEGVKSIYPMKTKTGQFSGLINLILN